MEIPEDAQQNAGIRFVTAERSDRPVTVEVTGIEERIHRFGLTDEDLAEVAPAGSTENVRAAVAEGVDLPPGDSLAYRGQFEHMERAGRRLAIVRPIALFLIFLLLYTAFNAVKPAMLVYLNIPLAATGGILALYVRV